MADTGDVYTFKMDPRLEHLSISKPAVPLVFIAVYLYTVYNRGPQFMKNRPPYNLKWITRIYNLLQIAGNLYYAVKMSYIAYVKMEQSIICSPPDKRTDDDAVELVSLAAWYWWLRVADFLDTMFFILRKKQSQVTFLHVFHHVAVVAGGWVSTTYGLVNLLVLSSSLNALVHVLMYSYYFLATLGPEVQKHLWWKKHLTKLQLAQFCILITHMSVPFFKDCGYPRGILSFWLISYSSITALFVNFYVQSYLLKKIR